MSDADEFAARTHYSYRISLRVSHPSMDPKKITEEFGIEPRRCWKAGEPRQTPKGTPLAGTYRESFWMAEVAEGRWPSELNKAIHDTLQGLVRSRSFLHHVRAEEGSVELFVGWFFDHQSGEALTYQCLALAGDLKIDLSFDVYPPEQPEHECEVSGSELPR